MKKSIKFMITGGLLILTALYILLIRTVDVAAIGAGGTSVGLSHLNQAVFDLIGVNMGWYRVTEVLGIFAILVCVGFAALGAWELIRRRSLRLVDREIYALAALYVAVIVLYVLFEKVVVNCRPILLPDETEPAASFPSSHTMLIVTVMGSTILVLNKYINDIPLRRILQAACGVILIVTVVGRFLSGVHWTTDILGGILISETLLTAFKTVIDEF